MKPISILITNRNTLEFLQLAIESVRKNQSADNELIIMDDNSTDGSKEWLESNKEKYKYTYYTHTDKERHGIVGMVDEAVAKATNEIVYILHSDMVCGEKFDSNLVKHLKPKTVVCSTRIEPPLHPPEPCKITQGFGNFPKDFQHGKFDQLVKEFSTAKENAVSEGVFAPTLCYKKDWLGHDKLFYPQSREDSDWQYEMVKQGYKFIQSWDSLVYHFTSRGSRYNNETKETLKDSDEWKKTNGKNTKNFIRKWGTTPLYTQTKNPIVIEKVPISAHILACDRDAPFISRFLNMVEPYFDELVFVIDIDTIKLGQMKDTHLKTKVEEELEKFTQETIANGPTNFTADKIKILYRNLEQNGVRDFAAQTNFAIQHCKNEWVMKIDLDEAFSEQFLNSLSQLVQQAENMGKNTIAFPRLNYLNDVLVNDLPRTEWTEEKLLKYPKHKPGQKLQVRNPDYQFRLHTKNLKWVGKVHEVPETIAQGKEEFILATDLAFGHPKTVSRQDTQNQMYSTIADKKEIKKIIYDSVIFTTEGITKHAREEVKQWESLGHHVQIMDTYRFNPNIEDCEYFKKFYNPVDVVNDDYVTICNQPPERWNKTLGYKNFIGHLAFEGYLPAEWTKTMNHPNVKEIWTPSNYCKQTFLKSGVQKPITVIPHGINPDVWKPLGYQKKQDEPFTFLWMGTSHNSRKGMDIMIKAFSSAFKPEDDVRLILKVNKIYDRDVDTNSLIKKYIVKGGNQNIFMIDDELTENQMVELVNRCQVYVSPHRSEGFGINILQALATGIPVIATRATGNLDFCNDSNTHFIEVEKHKRWSPFLHPYENAMWDEPKTESLIEVMTSVMNNYEQSRQKSIKESRKIREEWTWRATVNMMKKRVNTL